MDATPATPRELVQLNQLTPETTVAHSPVDVTRLLCMLYQDLEIQINRADSKAQITLSSAAIVAAIVSSIGHGMESPSFARMQGPEMIALIIYLAFGLCICGAIGFALAVAFPRSIGPRTGRPADLNLYFSAHIIQMDPADYVARFSGQTNHEVKERMLGQIHVKSRVLEVKLKYVRVGLVLLGIALVLWIAARALLALSYGRLLHA